MAYLIKHCYEPCDSLSKNKIKQRELTIKALTEIKSNCSIVKNTGEFSGFYYIEFKENISEKLILELINMICCKEVGNIIFVNKCGNHLKLKIPLIVQEEQIDFMLNFIKTVLSEL
jgi:4-aminobutyrate aminotransferase-like enzyme